MNLKELMKQQEAIVNAAKAEKRGLTDEEQKKFDELQAKIDVITSANNAQQKAVEAERKRVAEINDLCRSFDMDPSTYITEGTAVEAVRTAILDELAKKKAPVANVQTIEAEGDKFRAAAIDGLRMRSNLNHAVKNAAPGSESFTHMSLKELGRECLVRDGVRSGEVRRMSDDQVMQNLMQRSYYNPTAAFPAILDTTIRKNIVDIYQAIPTTFEQWTTKGSLPDFKESADHNYVMGGLSDFAEVPEGGEIKADVPQSALLPTKQLKTYGKQFSMTRQAFINDDIGFLSRVPGVYAAKAKDTIDSQVYKILVDNGNIFDGNKLFDTKHGNVASKGAVPSIDALKEMYLLMGKQTNQFGDPITVIPRYVLIGNQNQFDVYTTLHSAQVTGSNNNDVNPFYGADITPIIVNKLDAYAGTGACPWFVVADPMSAPSIEVDYLNGSETPTVRRMEQPGVLGYTWDIYLDWGITVTDFRGIYKNPGTK